MPTLATKPLAQMVADQAVIAQATAPSRSLDFSVGSILRALAEAYGSIGLWLQGLILRVLAASRAVTSTGTDLDSWMGDYGLTRSAAQPARGEVTFSRFSPGIAALVPIGAEVKTQDAAWTYRVVSGSASASLDDVQQGYTFPSGQGSITLPVVATTAGVGGNAAPNTVTLLSTAIPGVDQVTNALALTGGAEAETDEALRIRFVAYVASLSRATKIAIDFAISQVQAGLTWSILEQQRPDGSTAPATFTVVVDDGTGAPPSSLLSTVSQAVEQYRPLGVSFAVVAPVVLEANVTMTLTHTGTAPHAEVVGIVSTALENYINAIPLGSGLSYTRLAQVAYAADPRVENVTAVLLNGASADIPAAPRRAVRAGVIAVS